MVRNIGNHNPVKFFFKTDHFKEFKAVSDTEGFVSHSYCYDCCGSFCLLLLFSITFSYLEYYFNCFNFPITGKLKRYFMELNWQKDLPLHPVPYRDSKYWILHWNPIKKWSLKYSIWHFAWLWSISYSLTPYDLNLKMVITKNSVISDVGQILGHDLMMSSLRCH